MLKKLLSLTKIPVGANIKWLGEWADGYVVIIYNPYSNLLYFGEGITNIQCELSLQLVNLKAITIEEIVEELGFYMPDNYFET